LDAVPAEYVAHGLIGNDVAEIGQRSDDAVVSPARVLDERLYLVVRQKKSWVDSGSGNLPSE
jgi:hypothetical protein